MYIGPLNTGGVAGRTWYVTGDRDDTRRSLCRCERHTAAVQGTADQTIRNSTGAGRIGCTGAFPGELQKHSLDIAVICHDGDDADEVDDRDDLPQRREAAR